MGVLDDRIYLVCDIQLEFLDGFSFQIYRLLIGSVIFQGSRVGLDQGDDGLYQVGR